MFSQDEKLEYLFQRFREQEWDAAVRRVEHIDNVKTMMRVRRNQMDTERRYREVDDGGAG